MKSRQQREPPVSQFIARRRRRQWRSSNMGRRQLSLSRCPQTISVLYVDGSDFIIICSSNGTMAPYLPTALLSCQLQLFCFCCQWTRRLILITVRRRLFECNNNGTSRSLSNKATFVHQIDHQLPSSPAIQRQFRCDIAVS